ncbi:MAG TPA: hypothetical protein VNE71_08750 [Myxococcota bacterium]|nr:hypothetical protein [Myxococcota bacterium]
MPNELKIRGPSFQIARRDVLVLVESGRLTRAALEARLDPDDLELLEETPRPNAWYPLATYDRLLALLVEFEGQGDPTYLVRRAHKGSEELMRGGVMRQLESADTVVRTQEGGSWFEQAGHVLATIPAALFDRGSWRLSADEPKRSFTLEGTGLVGLTPNVAQIIQGGIEYVASELIHAPVEVTLRLRGDRVTFVGRHS